MPIEPQKTIRTSQAANAWNRMRDAVHNRTPIHGDDQLTSHTTHGVIREILPQPPPVSPAITVLNTYRVKSKVGDVLFCVTWDGTTEGEEEVPIAVNRNSRQLDSETINSVTYTYTAYTDIGDGINETRTSDDGTTEETQIVTPMWYEDCEIDVIGTNYSGVLYDNTVDDPYDLKLIEVSARCWAKVADAP